MPGNYETMKILGSLYSNSGDPEKKEIAKVMCYLLVYVFNHVFFVIFFWRGLLAC